MAVWLEREGLYEIDDRVVADYLILLWPDGAPTRQRNSDPPPLGEATIVGNVANDKIAVFLTKQPYADKTRYMIHRVPVRELPFSTYELGGRSPTAISVLARQPKADDLGNLIALKMMPPRGVELVGRVLFVDESTEVAAQWQSSRGKTKRVRAAGYSKKAVDDPHNDVSLEFI